MPNNLFSKFREQFPAHGAQFIRTSGGRELSYGDMVALSGRMANALRALGVWPGDRIAVQVEKSPEAIVLYLAALRIGAVFLPLNTAYTPAEIEYFLSDSEPTLFIAAPEKAAQLAPVVEKLRLAFETMGTDGKAGTFMERVLAAPQGHAEMECNAHALAAILYTSGTTGRSKGAMLTHANLASNALALKETWRFTKDDVLLHALPIFHTHGLFVATNVMLMAGGSTIFLPKFDAGEIFRLMPDATTMMGVPTFYVRLAEDARLTREATKHMRLFISGSAPLLTETHLLWQQKTGHAILERYGMTETNMNTSNPYDGERVPGSVGLSLPGVEVRITDPASTVVPAQSTDSAIGYADTGDFPRPVAPMPVAKGAIGMIEVRGPNVFAGYWRMADKTRAELREDGFFITGDLGRVDEKGYLHIVGRGKDLVISGGFNVYPREVESEIDALPGVVESAVFGVPHKDFGEGVTAIVVCAQGAGITEEAVLEALKARLANYKVPKRVIFAGDLPRNTMGKVQKNMLRETYGDLYTKVTL